MMPLMPLCQLGFDLDALEGANRKDLQKWAKIHAVKANAKVRTSTPSFILSWHFLCASLCACVLWCVDGRLAIGMPLRRDRCSVTASYPATLPLTHTHTHAQQSVQIVAQLKEVYYAQHVQTGTDARVGDGPSRAPDPDVEVLSDEPKRVEPEQTASITAATVAPAEGEKAHDTHEAPSTADSIEALCVEKPDDTHEASSTADSSEALCVEKPDEASLQAVVEKSDGSTEVTQVSSQAEAVGAEAVEAQDCQAASVLEGRDACTRDEAAAVFAVESAMDVVPDGINSGEVLAAGAQDLFNDVSMCQDTQTPEARCRAAVHNATTRVHAYMRAHTHLCRWRRRVCTPPVVQVQNTHCCNPHRVLSSLGMQHIMCFIMPHAAWPEPPVHLYAGHGDAINPADG